MKLGELNASDRFYYMGKKYSVFLTIRDFKGCYTVHVFDWPMPNGSYELCSMLDVKPILTIDLSE